MACVSAEVCGTGVLKQEGIQENWLLSVVCVFICVLLGAFTLCCSSRFADDDRFHASMQKASRYTVERPQTQTFSGNLTRASPATSLSSALAGLQQTCKSIRNECSNDLWVEALARHKLGTVSISSQASASTCTPVWSGSAADRRWRRQQQSTSCIRSCMKGQEWKILHWRGGLKRSIVDAPTLPPTHAFVMNSGSLLLASHMHHMKGLSPCWRPEAGAGAKAPTLNKLQQPPGS